MAGSGRDDDLERVREYLRSRPADELVERIIDLTLDTGDAWLSLVSEVRVASGDLDIPQLKKDLTAALRVHGYMHWRQVDEYARDVEAILDLLRRLLEMGRAADVVGLAEHVMARLDTAMGHIDDSDGQLGLIHDDLPAIHLAACEAARPDPRKLGARLAEIALRSDCEWFLNAPVEYAHVLDEPGLAAYRARVDREWAKLPALPPGTERRSADEGVSRFLVSHLKESLARAVGDVDELVAVIAHDQSSPHRFVRIAEELDAAGREREALTWLERGYAAFPPDGGDARLRGMLVDAYRRDGLDADALRIARAAFDTQPGAATYAELRHAAGDIPAWGELRGEALRRLRELDRTGTDRYREAGRSEAVRVQLDEGEVEAAWRDAVEGGCSESLWYQLAELRQCDHPDDALAVYRRHLGRALARADVRNYAEAVRLLLRIEETLGLAGRGGEFAVELQGVRDDNRRRPKLMEMLSRRWP